MPKTNHLINEKSPYLQQHATNPVDWYPWGDRAFEKAKKEDKPVFLSIGYSTCHWCHVMAHESFEDNEVAQLINKYFISVKVDREERPDIDDVYMTFCQLMTGSGGWPLTIFMTPEKKPFFAATYIPKKSSQGRTGLIELIPKVGRLWKEQKGKIINSAFEYTETLQRINQIDINETVELDQSVIDQAYNYLSTRFDNQYGGFGNPPKFPLTPQISFLFQYFKKTGRKSACEMAEKTLQAMRSGGIYDHLGYGFHRYSTDSKWLVPHFEKMLYDQALLAQVYLEAYQVTGKNIYANTVREIFAYIKRDMYSAEGAFYSAEDADSEGVEGKFYIWSEKEIKENLSSAEASKFMQLFNIKPEGNYKEESTGKLTGQNILHLKNIQDADKFKKASRKLFKVREKRIHPHKDKKILTDWNGLMITALSRAGNILKQPQYIDMAEKAVFFIKNNMFDSEGRLLHRYKDGEAGINGNLNDYSFLIQSLIELYQANYNIDYLKLAIKLQRQLIDHFWDQKNGGFYFTPDDGEKLLTRKKPIYDGILPSGNSISLWNLLRLFHITGDPKFKEKAERIIEIFSSEVKKSAAGYLYFLKTYNQMIDSFYCIIITGKRDSQETKKIMDFLRTEYIPAKVVIFKSPEDDMIEKVAPYTREYEMREGKTTVYICKDQNCQLPTTDIQKIKQLLSE